MSTHNICFRQEIRKLFCGYPSSVAMIGCMQIYLNRSILLRCFRFADGVDLNCGCPQR